MSKRLFRGIEQENWVPCCACDGHLRWRSRHGNPEAWFAACSNYPSCTVTMHPWQYERALELRGLQEIGDYPDHELFYGDERWDL